MNMLSVVEWMAGAGLVARCTALLAVAWLAHAALARTNPRWRVALWRATVLGLAGVAVLAALPPLVVWEVPVEEEARTEVVGPLAVAAPAVFEAPPAVVVAEAVEPAVERRPERGEIPARLEEAWESPVPPGGWWRTAWLAGVISLGARLAVGAGRLRGLVSRAEAAPAWVLEERDAIAARLGLRREVRVRVSAEVQTPCLVGAFRTLLLLPAEGERDDLRAVLAHELAHARGNDLIWNHLLHGVGLLLWFHPLAWRVRAAHAAACDGVCDAVAADLLGDVHAYGRTLARLALRVAGSSPAPGLAMARTAEVRRRIEFLQRRVFRAPLPRRMLMPAMLLSGLMVAVVGGVGIGVAQEGQRKEASAPAPAGQAGRMTIRVTDAETGGPLEGAEVAYRIGLGSEQAAGKGLTGMDGALVIDLPDQEVRTEFVLWIRKNKYVPAHVALDGRGQPLDLPPEKVFALQPGKAMGGVVVDEQGRPIEGTTVSVRMPATETNNATMVFDLGSPKTDAGGRWRIDEAPGNLGQVYVSVAHPRFRPGGMAAVPGLEARIVLARGPSVTGRVVDGEGRPVKGAQAILGRDTRGTHTPTATTDESGGFTLENCETGSSVVTIQAEGYAPELRDVRVGAAGASEPLEFRIGPPGVIRGRVVDREGKPIAGAWFAADRWRGTRSILHRGTTDDSGEFSWESAPADAVQFDFGKEGYMSIRGVAMVASEQVREVVLPPVLTISGRVADATTGESVGAFRVVEGLGLSGRDIISWLDQDGMEYSGGKYTRAMREPYPAYFLRFEADGYAPKVSRAFAKDEGDVAYDVALTPMRWLEGVVVLPDGRPAVGAEVGVARVDKPLSVRGGAFVRRQSGVATTRADAEGRFRISPQEGEYAVAAISDAGYAEATAEEFSGTGKLVLAPWGKVEGKLRIGGEPGANQEVYIERRRLDVERIPYFYHSGAQTRTGPGGEFRFDRVRPGPVSVSLMRVIDLGERRASMARLWSVPVDVLPGATLEVTLGGGGRPVVGRVVLEEKVDPPIDWTRNEAVRLIQAAPGEGGVQRQFGAVLDAEGRFRVEDVPPGAYTLDLNILSSFDRRYWGGAEVIGGAEAEVTVPEGPADQPVEVGEVRATLLPTLGAGEVAPELTGPTLAGGPPFKLSEQKGKVVVLVWWMANNSSWIRELPIIEGLRTTFEDQENFEMVGVVLGRDLQSAGRFAEANGLVGWTQVFVGSTREEATAPYHVGQVPTTFLIGPDGRVLARGLRGEALEEAVRKALEEAGQ